MSRTLTRSITWLVAMVLIGVSFGGAAAVSFAVRLPTADEFNIVAWELRHVPGKWLYLGGRLAKGELSREQEDGRLARFFELTSRIERLERSGTTGDDSTLVAELRRERDRIENDVEAVIEGRITAVLEDAGLTSSLPFFPAARWVFPPVDVEFDDPPQVLSVSPRERIELTERRPLRHDLAPADIVAIEAEVERDGTRSALVEPISGAATYPSIVEPDSDYQRLVETVAHEWVHQFLFFKPLGRRFYSSLELRTLNETAATLAGAEISVLVAVRYPLQEPYGQRAPAGPAPVDLGPTLRQLRLEVDLLLAAGEIERAEAWMEQRRQELARLGIAFRRINQAFFAIRNVYATGPASTDPIGLKLAALRQRTGSVGAFLDAASRLTSERDLDAFLERR